MPSAAAGSRVTREVRQLLDSLDGGGHRGGRHGVIGPGPTVTITDPGVSKDLSDVVEERVPGSQQVILDRDLQLVVNSLRVSGAEAVSVGVCVSGRT